MAEEGSPPVETPAEETHETAAPPSDWRSGLPDELKADETLKNFKGVPDLAKSYVEARKMMGDRVKLPGENATPEEVEKFYAKLGRPGKPDEYQIPRPENLPEGITWDDSRVEWFKGLAHRLNLTQKQASELVTSYSEAEYNRAHEGFKAIGKEMDALKEQWGDAFDGRIELGLRGIEHALKGGQDFENFKQIMDQTGLGNHPVMLKLAYAIGQVYKADGYIVDDGAGGVLQANGAKSKIDAINSDLKHPYWDANHPNHKQAVEEMTKLFRVVSAGGR